MKHYLSFRFFLAALLVCILIISSCKKNSGGSSAGSYYVKFKLDGVQKTYTGTAAGIFNLVDGTGAYESTIDGQKDLTVVDKNVLGFGISSPTAISANITYTNYTTATAGQVKPTSAIINYTDESGVLFSAWPDDVSASGVISDAKMIFTSATSSTLKGNFSGTLYKEIDGASPKHVVTEGEFYAQRVQ